MKQIAMEDIIIHSMHNFGSYKISVAVLLDVAREIFHKTKVAYSATTKHIFETIFARKDLFKLSKDGHFVQLLYPEMLGECVKERVLEDDVSNAIAEYIGKINESSIIESIENLFFEVERAGYLRTVSIHLDWILSMLKKYDSLNSCDYHLALTPDDLENFTMMKDFYRLVNIYCEEDLIPYEISECKSYVIKYVDDDEVTKYIELQEVDDNGVRYIRAIQREEVKNAVEYIDIWAWRHSVSYKRRRSKLDELQKQISSAKQHNIPYQSIKACLDAIYGIGCI